MTQPLDALQEWYASNCDGDWEHQFGVSITSLDNPGWSVDISLTETALQGRPFKKVQQERRADDWIHCWIERQVFKGRGGPRNLTEILTVFSQWIEAS